jgi:hypothetical protein
VTKPHNEAKRVTREATLTWVPIGLMRVPQFAQRKFRPAWANKLESELDLEKLGTPTVNKRGGLYYLIDGQHRVEAYKKWIGEGWENQQLHCWTYHDLSEQQMAETFLVLNHRLNVNTFEGFRIGVNANRPEETTIQSLVERAGLNISQSGAEGAIGAVGTLRKVYRRDGGPVLLRALGIIRDAYGTAGLEAPVIDGIGMLCGRYNGELDTEITVLRLRSAAGGVSGLLNKARFLKNQTNAQFSQCVAAAAVDLVNRGRGGKKIPAWWTTAA